MILRLQDIAFRVQGLGSLDSEGCSGPFSSELSEDLWLQPSTRSQRPG